jgi:hypothetical protein
MADMLKRQDREGGRTRHWRSNFKKLQRELLQLEDDEHVLDSVFPQVSLPRDCPIYPQTRQRLCLIAMGRTQVLDDDAACCMLPHLAEQL